MNTNSIITKYINLLYKTFLNDSLERCLSKATYQFDVINSGDKNDVIQYFGMLSEKNIALAAHVFYYYTKYSDQSIVDIRENLVYQTGSQLISLRESNFVDLHQLKIDIRTAQKANVSIDEKLISLNDLQVEELHRLADICFASLVLNDYELMHSVFSLMGEKIKDDISCDKCIDRFSEHINSISEIDRGRLAVKFLSLIYYVVKPINNEFSLKIVLHFKLNSTIVGKEYINELSDLCKKLVINRDYRFLRHVVGCFSEVTLDSLGINEKTLIKRILDEYPSVISNDELYYGLRIAEDYNSQSRNVDERLDYWWSIVKDTLRYTDRTNGEEYKFFKTYYNLRRIQNNPECFSQVEKLDDIEHIKLELVLIDVLEQNATAMLILSCPEHVEAFIKWLGDWNYYKYNENGKRFLWAAQDDNGRNYISILTKHYKADALIYIYMNSFLRSAVPINILLNGLYDISEKQREDYLMVKKLFSPYRMCAKLRFINNKLLCESVSFNTKGKGMSIHNLTGTVRAKLKDYYINNRGDNSFVYIHFHIAAASVKDDFKPDIHLDYNEFLNQDISRLDEEAFNRCIEILKDLSTRQIVKKEDLNVIDDIPRFKISPKNHGILGMSIVGLLNNLNSNSQRVKAIKRIRINPYAYNYPKNNNYGDLMDDELLKAFMRKVVEEDSSFEYKLYIYFNTVLRLNVPFDYFIRKAELLDGRFSLQKMFLNQGVYCFGIIDSISNNGDEKKATVRTNVYLSGREKYILFTKDNIIVNDKIKFVIDYYDDEKREFVIGGYEIIKKKQADYFDIAAKARTTLRLTEIDKNILQKRMDFASVYRYRYTLAVYEAEAINLRKDDFGELVAYLSLIKKGSPWSFSKKRLPCIYENRDRCSFVDSMIIDIIRKYDMSLIVDLYFNTSLKSLISLDEMCGIFDNEGKLNAKTMSLISKFPLRLQFYMDHVRGSNIYISHYLDELLSDGKFIDGIYMVYEYDFRKKRVKLKRVERN